MDWLFVDEAHSYKNLFLYTKMRNVAGLSTSEAQTTAIELAPEGTGYRARTRFAKFFNLPELMNRFKEVFENHVRWKTDLSE